MRGPIYTLLIAVFLPLAAYGHHAYRVAYDFSKTETLEGKVVRLELVNPHARIYVSVNTADGETEEWTIEGPGRLALARRGWTDDMFDGGGIITAVGNPSSQGHRAIWLERLVMPDGTEILDPLVADELEIEAQRRERAQQVKQ